MNRISEDLIKRKRMPNDSTATLLVCQRRRRSVGGGVAVDGGGRRMRWCLRKMNRSTVGSNLHEVRIRSRIFSPVEGANTHRNENTRCNTTTTGCRSCTIGRLTHVYENYESEMKVLWVRLLFVSAGEKKCIVLRKK
jgi:hypothetical protein